MIKLVVKTLRLGDVEDPEIYLGAAAWDWFQTDHGAWVKERSLDMVYNQYIDSFSYGYAYKITATFNKEDA